MSLNLTTRAGKGSPLTAAEYDGNLAALAADSLAA